MHAASNTHQLSTNFYLAPPGTVTDRVRVLPASNGEPPKLTRVVVVANNWVVAWVVLLNASPALASELAPKIRLRSG